MIAGSVKSGNSNSNNHLQQEYQPHLQSHLQPPTSHPRIGSLATTSGATIVSYSWVQAGGLSVSLTGANAARPIFTAPQQSTILSFSLTVTDSTGAISSRATVSVTVT